MTADADGLRALGLQAGELRAVALATGAAVVASTTWYALLGDRLARYDEAYAGDDGPPVWLLPVEVARSATVATAVAVLARRTGTRGRVASARLAVGLWAAFPAVLLTGSVVHEKVPWQLAAVHGGDWLAKLVLIAGVVAGRRPG